MKHDLNQGPGTADQDSLTSDFTLIGQAIADAFRGLSSGSRLDCRCPKIHFAGWR